MKLKLRVLKGSGRGREFSIPRPQCIVGRGEKCHLRPRSEMISRRHCAILVRDGDVVVRDFESRNGTFVNGERVDVDRILEPGDRLQIGPLAFEILIDRSLGGEKKSKVRSVKEAATRTLAKDPDATVVDEGDISDWLEEADQKDRQRRLNEPETLQLRLDETEQVSLQEAIKRRADEPSQDKVETKEMHDRKTPGKLPQRARPMAKDSGEAAAEILRDFFSSR